MERKRGVPRPGTRRTSEVDHSGPARADPRRGRRIGAPGAGGIVIIGTSPGDRAHSADHHRESRHETGSPGPSWITRRVTRPASEQDEAHRVGARRRPSAGAADGARRASCCSRRTLGPQRPPDGERGPRRRAELRASRSAAIVTGTSPTMTRRRPELAPLGITDTAPWTRVSAPARVHRARPRRGHRAGAARARLRSAARVHRPPRRRRRLRGGRALPLRAGDLRVGG